MGNYLDYQVLEEKLESLLETLDETYSRILRRIPVDHKQNTLHILQLLTFSMRPLMLEELIDTIVVNPEKELAFDPKYRMPDPREICRYCSSLVVAVTREFQGATEDYPDQEEQIERESGCFIELRLSHFSVKEFLTSDQLEKDISRNF